MADTKISPYSLPDLKNTTDDALGNYLRGIGFKQDNSKTDVKLAVGYLAVIIAGATFVADYKLGWEATKGWTAVAVAAYAVLNGVFTYWLWFVEKGIIFEGIKDGKKVSLILCPITIPTNGPLPKDFRLVQGQQERANLLPRRHHHFPLLNTDHQTNPHTFHHMVYRRRLLCSQTLPTMARAQRGSSRRCGRKERWS
jgi:hypothetical protein